MSSRATIFDRITSATAKLPAKTELPAVDLPALATTRNSVRTTDPEAIRFNFLENWKTANGKIIENLDTIADFLKSHDADFGFIDQRCKDLLDGKLDGISFETVFNRQQRDSYRFGITRVSGAVAETGTLVLRDSDTSYRLGALAPWIHIALLDRSSIMPSLSDAVASFDDDPSIVFITGPSKTADIEGILIEGVHGPGIQACCII